jgi:hypothetical protein
VAGDRVALAPHTDEWMRGARFGHVTSVGGEGMVSGRFYFLDLDRGGNVTLLADDLLGAVNTIPGQGPLDPAFKAPRLDSGASPSTGLHDAPNEYGFVCAEFDADGSCIHSEHMMAAGL